MKILRTLPIDSPKSDLSEQSFYTRNRSLIVLTESGKPVFTSHGSEYTLSPIFATYSILLNKFAQNIDAKSPQLPLYFENAKRLQVFLRFGRLWLVLVVLDRTVGLAQLNSVLRLFALRVL